MANACRMRFKIVDERISTVIKLKASATGGRALSQQSVCARTRVLISSTLSLHEKSHRPQRFELRVPERRVWELWERPIDIVCALDVVSSYEWRLCVTFPIMPLMLRCPSSAAVQLWPLLLRKGPAPPRAGGGARAAASSLCYKVGSAALDLGVRSYLSFRR